MDKNDIKKITDKVVSPCLVGIRAFDADVQQYTCKFINGEKCECYRNYKQALLNSDMQSNGASSQAKMPIEQNLDQQKHH